MEPAAANRTEISELEACANRAWPAAHVEWVGGWQLRWSDGLTRRGNSVYAGARAERSASRVTLDERIGEIEAWYRARGAGALYQLSPLAPPELDAALASRGYGFESPVSIQTAETSRLAGAGGDAALEASVEADPNRAWRSVSVDRGRFAERPGTFQGFLDRIGARAGFALACAAGEPIAAALAVADGARVGIFAMSTLRTHRRRGAARALLGAIARWAGERNARELYLQVERDNEPALALYAGAGFRERYGYHYRREAG